MINIQVFQIVAEENSSSVLPAKTAKGPYRAVTGYAHSRKQGM